MESNILFRKRSPMTAEGLDWLNPANEHPYCANANTMGRALASAILVRALVSCVQGNVVDIRRHGESYFVEVESSTTPGKKSLAKFDTGQPAMYFPYGAPGKATYHVGVLAMVEAMLSDMPEAGNARSAYANLLIAYQTYGLSQDIKEPLLRAADELYYWLRYRNSGSDRLAAIEQAPNVGIDSSLDYLSAISYGSNLLTDIGVVTASAGTATATAPAPKASPAPEKKGFIGWQVDELKLCLEAGDNILMAGPTGSGKTMCLHEVSNALASGVTLIEIGGKEGMLDLDFLGAILPHEDGSRKWVDGPIMRAMRAAQESVVLVFIDEVSRIPRKQMNLLLTLLNPHTGGTLNMMGIEAEPDELYYFLEVPMTSEVAICPWDNLRFVVAGNFGRMYSVYELDPALRRRFETVLEFDYLEPKDEIALVKQRTGATDKLAGALVAVAQETRRLMGNGELPGCVDTASLLNWARRCVRSRASTSGAVMAQAARSWADIVCGRDHSGRVSAGNFTGIQDFLDSTGKLR